MADSDGSSSRPTESRRKVGSENKFLDSYGHDDQDDPLLDLTDDCPQSQMIDSRLLLEFETERSPTSEETEKENGGAAGEQTKTPLSRPEMNLSVNNTVAASRLSSPRREQSLRQSVENPSQQLFDSGGSRKNDSLTTTNLSLAQAFESDFGQLQTAQFATDFLGDPTVLGAGFPQDFLSKNNSGNFDDEKNFKTGGNENFTTSSNSNFRPPAVVTERMSSNRTAVGGTTMGGIKTLEREDAFPDVTVRQPLLSDGDQDSQQFVPPNRHNSPNTYSLFKGGRSNTNKNTDAGNNFSQSSRTNPFTNDQGGIYDGLSSGGINNVNVNTPCRSSLTASDQYSGNQDDGKYSPALVIDYTDDADTAARQTQLSAHQREMMLNSFPPPGQEGGRGRSLLRSYGPSLVGDRLIHCHSGTSRCGVTDKLARRQLMTVLVLCVLFMIGETVGELSFYFFIACRLFV